MIRTEYHTVRTVRGPLAFFERTHPVGFGEIVEVLLADGRIKHGQVLDSASETVVVQVFEGTEGIDAGTGVVFLDRAFTLPVTREMVGRILDGTGRPLAGEPPILSADRRDISGVLINPYRRAAPREFIQTGISAIDGMNTLIRGQKLPIFSGAGLPHNEIALQIARQAAVRGSAQGFAVVFAAMGITNEEARTFMEGFRSTGALRNAVVFLNLADDPAVERLITPRAALTAAEFLAYDAGLHVLVILTDMTNYCEALREVGSAREEVPGRRGYPGYMYTDLATIYERAGRVQDRPGSITQIPILTMPGDDITHPIPDLTGYITEGQIVVSREMHRRGIYPPINMLPSLSRLMGLGIGKGLTRHDHKAVSDQCYSLYAEGLELRGVAAIVGRDSLTPRDTAILGFAEAIENRFVRQGRDENRSIEETLDIGWDLLRSVPENAITRIDQALIDEFLKGRAAE
ncbi:MAG: V-type ATP synthase subunit B [Planctomycetota bacterium]